MLCQISSYFSALKNAVQAEDLDTTNALDGYYLTALAEHFTDLVYQMIQTAEFQDARTLLDIMFSAYMMFWLQSIARGVHILRACGLA